MTNLADVNIVVKADVAVRDKELFDMIEEIVPYYGGTAGRLFTNTAAIEDAVADDSVIIGMNTAILEVLNKIAYEVAGRDMDVEIYLEEE